MSNNINTWLAHNENAHLGSNPEQIHKKLTEKSKDIGYHKRRAVKNFSDNSGHINRALYRDKEPKSHEATKRNLDHLTSQPTEHEHHVYTGIGKRSLKAIHDSPDGIVHLKGYTSTSISKEVAKGFGKARGANTILHIHVKKGDKIHHIHPDHTWTPEEREGILPRNTKLKVHPNPDVYKDYETGQQHHVYHATIHSQE